MGSIADRLFQLCLVAIFVSAIALGTVFDTTILAIVGVLLVGFLYGKFLYQKGFRVFMISIALAFLVGFILGTPVNLGLVLGVFIISALLGYYAKKEHYI